MEAVRIFVSNPQIKHGDIKFGFTPDEEIGRGADHFNVTKFGAKYAYTVDGGELGEISTETFSADAAVIKFHGVSMHPGSAKGKLINSQKMAAHMISLLPKDRLSPETTEGKEGFVHITGITGNEQLTTMNFIIRDFDNKKLREHGEFLKRLVDQTVAAFPKGASGEIKITEQYRNMKEILDKHPMVEKYAIVAMQKLNIKPIQFPVRGGTDGSRLSFMGLPCPNIFDGGQNFHSNSEWASLNEMQQAAQLVLKISEVYEEMA
jgi:tripeptide aminopeptidase